MPSESWMNKENIVYTCNGILFYFINEGKYAIYNDVDEPGGHYAE